MDIFCSEEMFTDIVRGDCLQSESVFVDSGVSQGTVLRPLLFHLHINDIPLHVKSQVRFVQMTVWFTNRLELA